MDERGKQLVFSGLDRALAICRIPAEDVPSARAKLIDWGLVHVQAARMRCRVVGGLGVVVPRPGRAELRPFELVAAGPGEVTVEMLASAISAGTERAQWLRLPNARPELPFTPGYSGAGRVLSVGGDVTGIEVGATVAVLRARHASVMTVPAGWVVPVPAGVQPRDAALAYLAVISGYGIRRAGQITGEPVCVMGAGPIGTLAQRMAMLEHPGPVTVVARSQRREQAAMRAGATRFLTADDDLREVRAAAVIEATGDPQALRAAVAAARPGGTVILLGSPRGVTHDVPLDEIREKGVRLVGAHISALAIEARRSSQDLFAETARSFIDALAQGRMAVEDLAGERVDPREINRTYRRIGRNELDAAHLDWSRIPRHERVRTTGVARPPRLRPRGGPGMALPAPSIHQARSGARALRFAVIGCGDIGFANARAIAAAGGAQVTLAYDTVGELADAVVARFGGTAVRSLDEALDPARSDEVFLSVPHDLHVPLAIRAAEAGLHVVVEKPLSVDLAGGEAASAATDAAGVALSAATRFAARGDRGGAPARAGRRAGSAARRDVGLSHRQARPVLERRLLRPRQLRLAGEPRSRGRRGADHEPDPLRRRAAARRGRRARVGRGIRANRRGRRGRGRGRAVDRVRRRCDRHVHRFREHARRPRHALRGVGRKRHADPRLRARDLHRARARGRPRRRVVPARARRTGRRAAGLRRALRRRNPRGSAAGRRGGRRPRRAGVRRCGVHRDRQRGARAGAAAVGRGGMTASIAAAAVAALPAGGEVAVTGGGQLADALRSRLGPRIAPEHDPVPAVIDTTGDPKVIAASLARLDDLGTLVLAGPATPGPAALDLYADLHVRGLTVVGIPGG